MPPRLLDSNVYDEEGRPPLQEQVTRPSPKGKQQDKPLSQKPGTGLPHREKARSQKQAGGEGGQENGEGVGWKDRGTAPGPHPCTGNGHPTADREPPRRGGNRPQGQIHNKQQATRDSQVEDPRMGEPFEKNLQQREGDRTTSQGESKGYMPQRPTGSSSFPELDPNTQKEGGAEAREGCYPGGEKNKASSQYLGEPELPRPMKTVTEKRGKGDQGEKLDRDRTG